jgi:hypothetical protein
MATPSIRTATVSLPMSVPLPAQLRELIAELEAARARAHRLVAGLTPGLWRRRPAPGSWSIAEQIAHLSLASQAYLPAIEEALEEARERGLFGDGPFRRDFLGWMLCRLAEPPVRLRVRTTAPFVPQTTAGRRAPASPTTALAEFDRLQDELVAAVQHSRGLAIDRMDMVSPFDRRVHYNLYSCLRSVAAHQRRHLWLGEQARTAFLHERQP